MSLPDNVFMINQWTNGTEILNVKPNGDCKLGNGVDPLVALGELSKAFMKQQQRINRLEEAGDEAIYPFEYAARVRIWNEAKEAKP